jgi:hypothetical protein
MADEPPPQSWWQTLPGIITGISGLIGAITALLVTLHQWSPFGPTPASAPSTISPSTSAAAPATTFSVPSAVPTARAGNSPRTPNIINQGITDSEVEEFVNRYIAAQNSRNLQNVLDLYNSEVDYFAIGIVSKARIRLDKERYYQRWPYVRNTLSGEIKIHNGADENEKLVSFTIDFEVRNPDRGDSVLGTALDSLTLRNTGGDLKIAGENQTVLRKPTS